MLGGVRLACACGWGGVYGSTPPLDEDEEEGPLEKTALFRTPPRSCIAAGGGKKDVGISKKQTENKKQRLDTTNMKGVGEEMTTVVLHHRAAAPWHKTGQRMQCGLNEAIVSVLQAQAHLGQNVLAENLERKRGGGLRRTEAGGKSNLTPPLPPNLWRDDVDVVREAAEEGDADAQVVDGVEGLEQRHNVLQKQILRQQPLARRRCWHEQKRQAGLKLLLGQHDRRQQPPDEVPRHHALRQVLQPSRQSSEWESGEGGWGVRWV